MRLLIFEGIDGAGKTTVAKRIKEYLESKGMSVSLYKEPYHDIPPNSSPFTQMLFFTASRSWLFENLIKPDLQSGKVVILDRSFISTYVYQCEVGGVDYFITFLLNSQIIKDIDFVIFFLDVSPEVAYSRKREANIDTLNTLRQHYLKILKNNAYIIQASDELDKVVESVKLYVDEIIRPSV